VAEETEAAAEETEVAQEAQEVGQAGQEVVAEAEVKNKNKKMSECVGLGQRA
jgi:hypothetical protein